MKNDCVFCFCPLQAALLNSFPAIFDELLQMFTVQEVAEFVRGTLGSMPSTVHIGQSMDVVKLQSIARTVDSRLFSFPGRNSAMFEIILVLDSYFDPTFQLYISRLLIRQKKIGLQSSFAFWWMNFANVHMVFLCEYFFPFMLSNFRVKEDSPTCGFAPHPSSSEAAKRTAYLFRDLEQHLFHHQGQFAGKLHRLHICMLS